jgi:hypothetical protein
VTAMASASTALQTNTAHMSVLVWMLQH